jgi:hypothetical protein
MNPLIFSIAALVLVAVAMAASYLPARALLPSIPCTH